MPPLVSINIITYNRAGMLERCLQSVFSQTCKDFEVIIVDDGSSDSTEQVASSFPSHKIQYHRVEHSGRISILRNLALERSEGRYIALLDSDDEWVPSKLETHIILMENATDLGMTFSDITQIDPRTSHAQNLLLHDRTYYQTNIIEKLFIDWFIMPSAVVFRKSCLESTGKFDPKLVAASEPEFLLRLVNQFPYEVISEWLVVRHLHDSNRSTRHWENSYKVMMELAQRYHGTGSLSMRAYRRTISRLSYRLGSELSRHARHPEARRAFQKSLSFNPLNYRAGFRWIMGL